MADRLGEEASGPVAWGPDWLTRAHLRTSLALLVGGTAVGMAGWLLDLGGEIRTVSESPRTAREARVAADSALELADSALDAIDDLQETVQGVSRSVKVVGCLGVDLEPIAEAQLRCSQLTSSIPDTASGVMQRVDTATRSALAMLGVVQEAEAAETPDRTCIHTLDEATRYIRDLAQGRMPDPCRQGAAP